MRLHFLEHDPIDFSRTNITAWAGTRGYQVDRTYLCNEEKLPCGDDFDWLMVMGGSQHAWEEDRYPWLRAEKRFIANTVREGKIVIGICFGAQLLAEVLGARVFHSKHAEIGWYEVSLTAEGKEAFLFRNIQENFKTFHWHSDHFSLPPGCTRLAFSEPTLNQAFICTERPVVGMQFHPEYTTELVASFACDVGDEWVKGPFVADKETVLKQTQKIPDTYGLMATLLDNIACEFGKSSTG